MNVDVLAFYGLEPGSAQTLTQVLVPPGAQGRAVSGIYKLVQRFLLALLTRVGSLRYAPTTGSTFLEDFDWDGWRTAADIQQSFYSALPDVRQQLVALEQNGDSLDERFDSAVLVGVNIQKGRVALNIKLKTRAGSTYAFAAPVATV